MKRRNFVLGTVSGLAIVANTQHVFARALAQTPLPGLPGSEERCLVLVNLYGGNDGLNCVVPHGDPRYYQMRPSLGDRSAGRHRDKRTHRPQSRHALAQGDVRPRHGRDRPRRRVPESRPLALPLDGDLADRRTRALRAHRLARDATSTAPACRRRISSKASRSRASFPRRSSRTAPTSRRFRAWAATRWRATRTRPNARRSRRRRATGISHSPRRISRTSCAWKATRSAVRRNCRA